MLFILAAFFFHVFFFQFNPESPVSPQDEHYRSNPSLQDQAYCLVIVMPADKISLTKNDQVSEKIKYIKNKANELGEYKSKKMSEMVFIVIHVTKRLHDYFRQSHDMHCYKR